MKIKPIYIVLAILFIVLTLDQSLKIWVKTNMYLSQEIFPLGAHNSWFRIHFTENPGMAFGLTFGGDGGKLALSLFRLVAVAFMGYYLHLLIRQKAHLGLISSITFIMAGALGNILDSAFYGVVFSESGRHFIAEAFPTQGGYAGFLYGRVVDMLYFPFYSGILPDWVPIWGGKYFEFFRPVFNLADSSITLGVFIIILFQTTFFKQPTPPAEAVTDNAPEEENNNNDSVA